ncbi:MAG: GDYXXLXY domain-containing protein [Synergistaceae bacterium]|jgi:uncharacterized membrane-anchored protein|nr:GDYXXLXY domain-containing protein [Synergistaceae bacterium]
MTLRLFKSLAVKYVSIAILPIAIMFYTPIVNFTILHIGARALLETIPVDPRDLLRGDYVILDYRITEIPDELLPQGVDTNDDNYYRKNIGDDVYVTLELDDAGVASISRVSLERPADGLYIKGTLFKNWSRIQYSCDYGLGAYYVPEGTGRELEEKINSSNRYSVYADVRILNGRGVIKTLEIRESDEADERNGPRELDEPE